MTVETRIYKPLALSSTFWCSFRPFWLTFQRKPETGLTFPHPVLTSSSWPEKPEWLADFETAVELSCKRWNLAEPRTWFYPVLREPFRYFQNLESVSERFWARVPGSWGRSRSPRGCSFRSIRLGWDVALKTSNVNFFPQSGWVRAPKRKCQKMKLLKWETHDRRDTLSMLNLVVSNGKTVNFGVSVLTLGPNYKTRVVKL